MGFLQIPPPQGFTREQQGLSIITGPSFRNIPPQGIPSGLIPPPILVNWLDDIGNQMIDDASNNLVFAS